MVWSSIIFVRPIAIAIEGPHVKYYKAKSGRYNFLSLKAKVFLRLTNLSHYNRDDVEFTHIYFLC